MDNNDKRIELTEDQESAFNKRVLGVMLDKYLNVRKNYENMEIEDEVKIILETIKIGRDEGTKINEELSIEYPDDKKCPYYCTNIDYFLLSCVVGGIVFMDQDDDYIKENLPPNSLYGNRIKSILAASSLLRSAEIVTEIMCDDIFVAGGCYTEKALEMLNMRDKNEQ